MASASLKEAECPQALPDIPTEDHVCALELSSGAWVEARGRVYGPVGAPAIIVLGGISAHRFLLGDHAEREGWWPGIAGPGLALDPLNTRLLAYDFLADEVSPYPSVDDQAEALLALADAAGLDRFRIVGSSYGGMIALALAAKAGPRVTRLDVLCAADRAHPMSTALRSVQRDIVRFALARGDGAGGVDLARRIAMTTYRTAEEFADRFRNPEPGSRDCDGVEAYLAARGSDYAARTSPQRFLALSCSMDSVAVDVSQISAPTRILAIDEDRLVPLCDIEAMAARFPDASLTRISSLYGHDAFLKETGQVTAFLTTP